MDTFLKGLFEALKWAVLLGFVLLVLNSMGFAVFPANVHSYPTYIILFLFFLIAVISAIY